MGSKECRVCNKILSLDKFNKKPDGKYGRSYRCKNCEKEYRRKYYKKNRDALIAKNKENYLENKEYYLEYKRQYYQDNKERLSLLTKKWVAENRDSHKEWVHQYYLDNKEMFRQKHKKFCLENPEKCAEYKRNWENKNKEKKRNYVRKRRARRRENVCFIVSNKFINKLENSLFCFYCGEKLGERHIDHVIPIIKDGHHGEGNLVASCSHCNYSKGGRYIIEFKKYQRDNVCTKLT